MTTIRRARPEDSDSLWQVHTRAIRELCGDSYSEEEIQSWLRVLKSSRYRESIANTVFLVAENDDRVVGFGNLDQKNGRVEAVYVCPECARRGVGKKILDTLEATARESGLRSLQLWSTVNAIPFYQSAGFRLQPQKRHLLASGMVVCSYMVKELC
jgi:N-acetylglutamate synthase-like GNAT family acetyltransferase